MAALLLLASLLLFRRAGRPPQVTVARFEHYGPDRAIRERELGG